MIKVTLKRVVLAAVIAVLVAVAIVATAFASAYWDYLMTVFGSSKLNTDSTTVSSALKLGDESVQEIAEDSIVLLKNENNALPLAEDERKVNLFGYASTENGWVYSGGGSGGTIFNTDAASADILSEIGVSLSEAFESEGFEVNPELEKLYNDFSSYNVTAAGGIGELYNPPASVYTHAVLRQAIDFSDVAVVAISRKGAEERELTLYQSKNNGFASTDYSGTYLQLTQEEEDMLEIVTDNFEKVIVLLNLSNPLECGFLENEGVDAALYVGITGQSGTKAIPRLLQGYKTVTTEGGETQRVTVTPSGRLSDTYAYSTRDYNPTDANMFARPSDFGQITYAEGIYVGYKWYETADAEGFFDDVETEYGKGYDGVVQYPFGHGLSYGTDFAYTVESSLPAGSAINADTVIKISVTVTNRSENAVRAGKDVVQLYWSSEYEKGKTEKSAINLAAFAKTQMLDPGRAQTFEFTFTPYDFASYDCYDANGDGHAGYELQNGDLTLSLRINAHTLAPCENAEIVFNVPTTINIDTDPVTQNSVVNRFTGESAYMDMPIDGSTAGGEPITYLSRADFAGSYPKSRTPDRTNTELINSVNTALNTRYDTDVMPATGVDSGLRLVVREDGSPASSSELSGSSVASLKYNDELVKALGSDYEEPRWDTLLNQVSVKEMTDMIANAFYRTDIITSVGKPYRWDADGPAGFHAPGVAAADRGKLVAFPAECLVGCSWNQELAFNMGRAQGVIASAVGINGWYAPGLNLHRNAYSGRYFEYYSEDPVLIGKLASEVVRGSVNTGLYCYMKHFAVSEEGINPENVKTWITEQALRETYLRPFEITTKEGKANAAMTAFNCLGAVWCGACDPLNNDILRTEWGFRGSLITDWSLGRPYMNGMQAIRAGNDLMMDSGEYFDSSPTTVSLLRTAVKNTLYTFVDTYTRASAWQAGGDQDDRYSVELKVEVTESPFSVVPVLMVVGIWLLAAAGSAVCVLFMIRKKRAPVGSGGNDKGDGGVNFDDITPPPAGGGQETSGLTPFEAAYAALSDDQRRRFDALRDHAMSKADASEIIRSDGILIKTGKKPLVRLKIRRDSVIALYKILPGELRSYKKELGAQVRETAIKVQSDETLGSAIEMTDETVALYAREREEAAERRRLRRLEKADSHDAEEGEK